MNNPLRQLQTAAKNLRLSRDEKAVMRARIFEVIDGAKYAPPRRTVVRSSYSIFSMRFAMPIAAFLLVVFAGGGTALAAQGALPGETLYPVKIYVNENVAGALAIGDAAKASYNISVAQTRLEEAETLASMGRLDATTTSELQANLDAHVAQARGSADSLAQSDPSAAVEAQVTLDSALAAHSSILSGIGDTSTDTATQENAATLAMNVAPAASIGSGSGGAPVVVMKAMAMVAPKAQPMTMSASDTLEVQASGTAEMFSATNAHGEAPAASAPVAGSPGATVDQTVAVGLEKKAEVQITRVRAQFAAAQNSLSTTTVANIQAHLDQFDATIRAGDDAIAGQDYATARAKFTSALKQSIELGTLITASKTFKKDFVWPVAPMRPDQSSASAGFPIVIEGSASSSAGASADTISNTATSGGSSVGATSSAVNTSGTIAIPPVSGVIPIGL
ncbi:MAG TPA: DUF5667 domain-containing protein [Candidatus Paceibacterota bacterium]|nr:DUF5667 domain-containing protein [Candidatus Paceibacterota bacterium]